MNEQHRNLDLGAKPPQAHTMIDVGDHRLALTSSGTGTPTVVLETGLGAESSDWAAVQQDLSTTARVIRYDRANRGASDCISGPRTALDLVDDLHRVLCVATVRGPYVLVGHSLGGLLMRLYAHRFPDEVAGLVLLDAMHQDQFDVFGPLFPPPTPSDPLELIKTRMFWQGGWRSPDATAEHIDLSSSIRQAREIISLGEIPLHVVIAGTFLRQPLIPAQYREPLQAHWQAQQMEFLKLSSRASYSLVLDSGHFLQRDAPLVVANAIRTVIASARGAKLELREAAR